MFQFKLDLIADQRKTHNRFMNTYFTIDSMLPFLIDNTRRYYLTNPVKGCRDRKRNWPTRDFEICEKPSIKEAGN